jgi:hypothetical protein
VFHSSPFFVDDPDIVSIFATLGMHTGQSKTTTSTSYNATDHFSCGAFHMSPPHTTMARTSV